MNARLEHPDVDRECERPSEGPGALGGPGSAAGAAWIRRKIRSIRAVGLRAILPICAPDVVQEPDALGGDRGAHLGGLGDALHELLRLVAREEALPDARRRARCRGHAIRARSTAGLSSAPRIASSTAGP